MALIRIAGRSELPGEGKVKEFTAGATAVCVACVNGRFSALDNVCLHRGGPLGQGVIEDGKVVCPWHGWQFDAATGQMGNAGVGVRVYVLKVEGDDVFVEI